MNKRTKWTPEQVEQMRSKYPDCATADLANELGLPKDAVYNKAYSMGLKKSAAFFASEASGRTMGDRGVHMRFKKGQAAWNKGMKGLQIGGEATRFKKGAVPVNALPVGTIRTTHDGYLEIKTAPGMRKWAPLSHWNWEKEHGQRPPKGMSLTFKDGDRQNCDPSNLELISRTDLMKRNTIHNLPSDLKELVQLKGRLNRQINKRDQHEYN
jgi:hypothetical protein